MKKILSTIIFCIVWLNIIVLIGYLLSSSRRSFNAEFDPLLSEDYVYFENLIGINSGLYAWSPDEKQILYLSANSTVFNIINNDGSLEKSVQLPYSLSKLPQIKDVEWFSDDKVSFVTRNNELLEFTLSTGHINTLLSPAHGIHDNCWSNNGRSLYVVETIKQHEQHRLIHYSIEQMQWNELIPSLERFRSISCSKTNDKFLINGDVDEVITNNNGELIRQEISLENISFVAALDQVPNSYFAFNHVGGNQNRYCIHFVNYNTGEVFPLFGMYRNRFTSLTYSSKQGVILIEQWPSSSEHTQLYSANLVFGPDNTPEKELVDCNL